jgi:protein-tyrosine phosphatase
MRIVLGFLFDGFWLQGVFSSAILWRMELSAVFTVRLVRLRSASRERKLMTTSSLLLFLCTGNYYRSRFAEVLFNWQATRRKLPWRAESRGIALDLGMNNRGPISPYALSGLQERGITLDTEARFPLQVQEDDFAQADHIIALDKTEHLPLLRQRFPLWVERVEFWQVPDLPHASVEFALATMETQVHELIRTFLQESS